MQELEQEWMSFKESTNVREDPEKSITYYYISATQSSLHLQQGQPFIRPRHH